MPNTRNDDRVSGRKRLPLTIPATLRCIPVLIPDDPEYFALFVKAVESLAYYSTWQWTEPTDNYRRQVVELWRSVVDGIQDVIASGDTCETGTPTDPEQCHVINPTHPSIGWYPNHPTLTPDNGFPWPAPAWCIDCGPPFLTDPADVLIRIDSAPFFVDLSDLLSSGVPSWTLHFSGTGQIDVRFRQTLGGGFCWVFPDGNPLLGEAVDLEWRDVNDFGGTELIETFIGILSGTLLNTTEVTHEVDFTTSGSHTLTAWYFPKVEQGQWPPIGWGGGLAAVQLCGDSIVLEESPLPYTMDCSGGVINLRLDGAIVSTVDLAVCYPHPPAVEIPEYALQRSNGDLRLLEDTVVISSVPYPNYSIDRASGSIRLFRDTVLHDTADLPDYLLVKPDPATINLTRDGTPISSVTDEQGSGGSVDLRTYSQASFNFATTNEPNVWSPTFNGGSWVSTIGFVSEVVSGQHVLDVRYSTAANIKILQVQFTVQLTTNTEGTLRFELSTPGSTIPDPVIFTEDVGPGVETITRTIPLGMEWFSGQSLAVQFFGVPGTDASYQIVLDAIKMQFDGNVPFDEVAPFATLQIFDAINKALS